ncbi:uncharacterized protein [Argopecten irradians]|uniref:uncharacterized protein n=1 Tax=Argopecten irradians TaxID=31199 RepID=UPI00372228F6
MACFNALGDYVAPLIVYPGQRFRDTGIKEFPEAIYAHSENGWMDKELFLSFLAVFNSFVEEKTIEKPVILFVDGHSTHMTAEAARFCAENHIILYCLLPNATHVMQACDVGFFSPMKSAWRGNVKQWQMDNLGKAFTKYDFPKVFKQSWETCATLSNAAHAFKRSGLFPLTPEGIDQSKLGPCKLISKEKLETKEREAEETDDGDTGANDINLSDDRPNAVALSCQAKHSTTNDKDCDKENVIVQLDIAETTNDKDCDKENVIVQLDIAETTNDKDCDKENVIVQRVIADVHVSAVVGNMTRNEHAVSAAFQTLVIPEIKTGKNKSKRKKLPKALSGHEALEMFKQKEEEKIEEERKKKERAEKRIENKQKKEEERKAKQERAEERKRIREEKEQSKRALKRSCKKLFDTDSEEEFLEDFESDADSHFCPGCQSTGGRVSEWVACVTCSLWWHILCSSDITLINLHREADIEAYRFTCDFCK